MDIVILSCRFDPEVEGGESLFLDSFHVAEEFRKQFPEEFDNLVRIPGTFQKIHFERYTLVRLPSCFDVFWHLIVQSIPTQVHVQVLRDCYISFDLKGTCLVLTYKRHIYLP